MQSSDPIPSAAPTHDPAETRSRLLDAAEQLFAEHGFNGVSMRTITGTAGVNLAAAHYHFQGKEGLYRAVFERRVVPMNEERARLLQACLDEEARTGQLDPSAVLDAFIGPAIRISAAPGADNFRRLSGRASADPSPEARRTIYELYDTVAARFVDILARACPHLAKEDLFWRLACIYGAMMYVRADSGRLQQLLGSEYSMADSSAAMHHIIPVLAAGLAVPSLAKSRGKGKRRSSRGS
jgi:AcrR family transcriptional regulator